jgi:hypothetical protein
MNANINDDELKLLAYLHEHSAGYGSTFPYVPGEIAQAMTVAWELFIKNASYLEEHGLVGLRVLDASSTDGPAFIQDRIWLTGDGENYMRELEERLKVEEKQPGPARKITMRVVAETGSVLRSIAVAVLTDFTEKKLRGT